jgi:hypothetical protein
MRPRRDLWTTSLTFTAAAAVIVAVYCRGGSLNGRVSVLGELHLPLCVRATCVALARGFLLRESSPGLLRLGFR